MNNLISKISKFLSYLFNDLIKKLEIIIKRPSIFFKKESLFIRNFYIRISFLLRKKEIIKRKKFLKIANFHNQNEFQRDGYMKLENLNNYSLIKEVLEEAKKDLRSHKYTYKDERFFKNYLQEVEPQKKLDLDHPYLKLGLNSQIIDIVSNYFGYLPILTEIKLWHSPGIISKYSGSQLFHLDVADIKQIKLFFLISDVTDNSGPTTLINAIVSKKICSDFKYNFKSTKQSRVSDQLVSQYIDQSDFFKMKGKKGTLFFADTSRCLHFGSRKSGNKRNLLMIQYLSPFSFNLDLKYSNSTKFGSLVNNKDNIFLKTLLGGNC